MPWAYCPEQRWRSAGNRAAREACAYACGTVRWCWAKAWPSPFSVPRPATAKRRATGIAAAHGDMGMGMGMGMVIMLTRKVDTEAVAVAHRENTAPEWNKCPNAAAPECGERRNVRAFARGREQTTADPGGRTGLIPDLSRNGFAREYYGKHHCGHYYFRGGGLRGVPPFCPPRLRLRFGVRLRKRFGRCRAARRERLRRGKEKRRPGLLLQQRRQRVQLRQVIFFGCILRIKVIFNRGAGAGRTDATGARPAP